jgi:signal transduction histidine kinase
MTKYFAAFVFFCVISRQTFAQDTIVLTDTTSITNIGKQIDMFEDPGEKLSLQQILSPEYQSQFKKSTQAVPNFGTKQTSVWSRIRIKNVSHKDWVLNVDFPNLHSVTLFQPSGDGYTKEETGRSVSFHKRKIKNRSFLFALELKPGEEKEVYLRVENHICIFPLYIADMTAISEKQHPEDILYGIFYGVSFIIAFYALALFLVSREIFYFYFFAQVFFFALYGMIYCGDSSRWLPDFLLPVTDFGTVIISVGIIFVYLFFDSVLKSKRKIPAASRTFIIAASLNAIAVLLYFVGLRSLTSLINMIVVFPVFFASVILSFYLKGEKIMQLIFMGFAIGFVVLIFWILMLQNLIPYSFFVNNLFIIQYLWWMIIFSIALELNINNYIKEKYKAQKESLKNLEEKEKFIRHQNEILEQKVEERTRELKDTQSQLVQREKMASLGELTAGIAHEIQNPLNFVNNFSEVNTELIDEMKSELLAGNKDAAISIADDIKTNEEKINHHGKRADAIVKGMLQHSRSSSGQKELTDINGLVDEYLRLSYHGLRAKDKSFNATMETNFDPNLEKINIVPQDVGRVILNLFTNAFYSVSEKNKLKIENPVPGETVYEPTVSVSTKKYITPEKGWGVEIRVKDNGMGIQQRVLDKIYQPFFTTKPAGEGTGLGLSLSYDIIKAHRGELKVNTKEGEFAEFTLLLPA